MRRSFTRGLAVAIVLSAFLFLQIPHAFAATYGPWAYDNAPVNGPLSGNSSTRWASDAFLWQVDASSFSSSRASSLSATIQGYDRCNNTDPWTQRMDQTRSVDNVTSMNVGIQTGYYFDCGQYANHSYQTSHDHLGIVNGHVYATSHVIYY